MRIMVLGGDGYIGWPLALHFSAASDVVGVLDDFSRREIDRQLGTNSLVPIRPLDSRINTWRKVADTDYVIHQFDASMLDYGSLVDAIRVFEPHAVIHLAEQRSAPYSMMSVSHARYTQRVNVLGTLNLIYAVAEVDPHIHIVKLGTMGEYGTPNIDIEEGWLDVEHNGRRDRVLYPKRPGSWYHLSKVHDSHNLEFACRAWGLRVTDLNQGVVYGHETDQTVLHLDLATRLDYDAVFGTVLNRFAVQAAMGDPLTVYGEGGQTRGFINLRDVMQCIQLACDVEPLRGEFRVFNQFTETFSVRELALKVSRVAGTTWDIQHIDNPRIEQEHHYYNAKNSALLGLGLEPRVLNDDVIADLIEVAKRNLSRVDASKMRPTASWKAPDARI